MDGIVKLVAELLIWYSKPSIAS